MSDFQIDSIANGYLLTTRHGEQFAFTGKDALRSLFEHLLSALEGISESFTGESYGRVIIERRAVADE